jgi:copper chaperone CopZ
MIRRQFIQIVALSGAGALAPLDTLAAEPGTTVVLQVKGFTCIACAVGLDTLLGKEKGIVSSHSSYPEGKVIVVYDPKLSTVDSIRKFIAGLGFTVERVWEG